MDVFFDDFLISHRHSPLIQVDDYYPGVYPAIFSGRLGIEELAGVRSGELGNGFLCQSKELQQDLGLDIYDFHARGYDPALGRAWQIDPHLENYYDWSPYSWTGNNPLNMIDPNGMDWYTNSESGNLHWYNGTYEDDKIPEGYNRLGDDSFFGEDSFERLQKAKENHKEEYSEPLNSMSFNEEQSGLLADQFGFEKVPSKQFKYSSESNFVVGQAVYSKKTNVTINEEFTYAAKGLEPSAKPIWTDITSYAGGFHYETVEIDEVSYSNQNLSNTLIWGVKIASWLMKINKGSNASKNKMNKTVNYEGWSKYPQNGSLNVYRPGGQFRKKLKL